MAEERGRRARESAAVNDPQIAIYECRGVGCLYRSASWFPRCPKCRAWSQKISAGHPLPPHVSLVPDPTASGTNGDNRTRRDLERQDLPPSSRVFSSEPIYAEPIRITAAEEVIVPRLTTGLSSLDRVLGGGLVEGSVILLGGLPGIGKSTLLAQLLAGASAQAARRVLYATGEESVGQAAMRARRVNAINDQIWIVAETDVDRVIAHARAIEPVVLAVDSIHTTCSDEIGSPPGSLVQVRECAAKLAKFARDTGTTTILIGHVTKSGEIAGPTLERRDLTYEETGAALTVAKGKGREALYGVGWARVA